MFYLLPAEQLKWRMQLTYTNKLYSINTDSDGNKPYFLVTVKHKTLGFSAQYKFFIGEEVSKVSPSKTTITF